MSNACFPEESYRESLLRNAVLVMWFEGVLLMSVPPIRAARNIVDFPQKEGFTRRGHHVPVIYVDFNEQTCEKQHENGFRSQTREETR